MRLSVLAIAVSSLALAGCGKEDSAGNKSVAAETVTAENFATADVTAIDAATSADANMAADVDINVASDNASGDSDATEAPNRPRPAPARPTAETNNASEQARPAPAEPEDTPAETNSQ